MARSFFILAFLILIISCNQPDKEPLLTSEPYALLTDSLKMAPDNPDLFYRRAILLYENDEKKFAEKDLRAAWKIQPKESYALSLSTILKERSADQAIIFLEEACRKLPESIAVRIALARGYQKKNNAAKALEICDHIISLFPAQLDALLLKAEILETENKPADALATMAIAYSYAPSDIELVNNYAFALTEAKDPRAVRIADSLIRMDRSGTHAEPYYFKGLYYENTGNPDRALKLFEEAVVHDYYFIDAHMEIGQVYYDRKNYKMAEQAFKLVSTITPTFPNAYLWTAKSQEAMGNKAEAKTNYQRAYGLDKSLTEARDAAARL